MFLEVVTFSVNSPVYEQILRLAAYGVYRMSKKQSSNAGKLGRNVCVCAYPRSGLE